MLQNILTALLLPPILLVLLGFFGGWLAARHSRLGRLTVSAAALGLLLLATPEVAGWLRYSLEQELVQVPEPGLAPEAIIILGGDGTRGLDGQDIGPLSLERLRRGAALARQTGLPLLVTGGASNRPDSQPLALLMARSLSADFGITPRWIEPRARDTRENASFSRDLLQADGIRAAYVVSHAWHLSRALEAFARLDFPVVAAPVRFDAPPTYDLASWIPRPDYWAVSWYMLREWAGRLVYALRDAR